MSQKWLYRPDDPSRPCRPKAGQGLVIIMMNDSDLWSLWWRDDDDAWWWKCFKGIISCFLLMQIRRLSPLTTRCIAHTTCPSHVCFGEISWWVHIMVHSHDCHSIIPWNSNLDCWSHDTFLMIYSTIAAEFTKWSSVISSIPMSKIILCFVKGQHCNSVSVTANMDNQLV